MLFGTFSPTVQRLHEFGYDLAIRFVPKVDLSAPVAVVAIDEKALEVVGDWPWSRDRIAGTIDQLRRLEARAIGLILPLDTPETPTVLSEIASEAGTLKKNMSGSVKKWVARLDTDQELARALAKADNVFVVANYAPMDMPASVPSSLGALSLKPQDGRLWYEYLPDWLLAAPLNPELMVRSPISEVSKAAAGVGLMESFEQAGKVRSVPLAVRVGEQTFPSLVGMLAGEGKGALPPSIVPVPGEGVTIGDVTFATAPDFRYYPLPVNPTSGNSAIPVYSLAGLWQSGFSADLVRGKVILIGITKPGLAPALQGPAGLALTPVTWTAYAVASLLDDEYVTVPPWFFGAQRVFILLLAMYLMLLPVRLRGRSGLLLSLVVSFLILNAGLVMVLVRAVWLPVVLPAIFLLVTHAIAALRHTMEAAIFRTEQKAAEAYRSLGLNLQLQGQLDQAFNQFLKCPLDKTMLEPLYQLGLDFERRRQYPKAVAVYERIANLDKSYSDVQERMQRLSTMADRFPLTLGTNAATTKTLVTDHPTVEKPVIGQYRLERELGKGAMGVVYLASDTRIGRYVAIKTLALSEEYEGNLLAEVRARFFREAEAAGRLSHPSIVTIYEVGEDQELAYISMDYAEGESLDGFSRIEHLLPVGDVLDIGICVADALHYAHGRNVVHRDVKPGNIIFDQSDGAVKVTDFGVACLTDDSRTRTGTVLGSPSYMSPEQVTGQKVDGRSDLFSLGVTLYQLLTGHLPFVGDSVANLAYQITNRTPQTVKKIRPDLPADVSRVISKSLQKDPSKRFPDGRAMADALRKCRKRVKDSARSPTRERLATAPAA